MKFKQCSLDKINGTCFRGDVEISYGELVEIFGQPHHYVCGNKSDVEWVLEFEDSTVATIYNWKDGKCYNGDEGLDVDNIRDWHIGGRHLDSVASVKAAIDSKKNNTK